MVKAGPITRIQVESVRELCLGEVKIPQVNSRRSRLQDEECVQRPAQSSLLLALVPWDFAPFLHLISTLDADGEALLYALHGESGDECRTDATAVLSGHDLDRVVAAAQAFAVASFAPVENLFQCLGAASLTRVALARDGKLFGTRKRTLNWGYLLNTLPSAPT